MCHRIMSKSFAFGETPYAGNPVKRLMVALASALCLVTGAWANTWDLNYYSTSSSSSISSFTAADGDVITGTMSRAFSVYIAKGATVTLRDASIDGRGSVFSFSRLSGGACHFAPVRFRCDFPLLIPGNEPWMQGFECLSFWVFEMTKGRASPLLREIEAPIPQ